MRGRGRDGARVGRGGGRGRETLEAGDSAPADSNAPETGSRARSRQRQESTGGRGERAPSRGDASGRGRGRGKAQGLGQVGPGSGRAGGPSGMQQMPQPPQVPGSLPLVPPGPLPPGPGPMSASSQLVFGNGPILPPQTEHPVPGTLGLHSGRLGVPYHQGSLQPAPGLPPPGLGLNSVGGPQRFGPLGTGATPPALFMWGGSLSGDVGAMAGLTREETVVGAFSPALDPLVAPKVPASDGNSGDAQRTFPIIERPKSTAEGAGQQRSQNNDLMGPGGLPNGMPSLPADLGLNEVGSGFRGQAPPQPVQGSGFGMSSHSLQPSSGAGGGALLPGPFPGVLFPMPAQPAPPGPSNMWQTPAPQLPQQGSLPGEPNLNAAVQSFYNAGGTSSGFGAGLMDASTDVPSTSSMPQFGAFPAQFGQLGGTFGQSPFIRTGLFPANLVLGPCSSYFSQ